jgi:hypothetical protein
MMQLAIMDLDRAFQGVQGYKNYVLLYSEIVEKNELL